VVLVSGTVTLAAGLEAERLATDEAALYLTVREPLNRLLPGSSSPPLASVRIPAAELVYPYSFTITAADLYPEFQAQPPDWCAKSFALTYTAGYPKPTYVNQLHALA
jgi:hypothetical protein